jgi:hypothetical protein
MKHRALLPQLYQELPPILPYEGHIGQIRYGTSPLFGKQLFPTTLQLLHPRTGETTFQSQSHDNTGTVHRNPQHKVTTQKDV